MVFDWFHLAIIVFLAAGAGVVFISLVPPLFLAPRTKGGGYELPYECGMVPYGNAWTRLGVTFYLYALLFLAFDVDVLYLFPAAVFYSQAIGWAAFWEVMVFIAVLAFACVFFYKKGVFQWPRKIKV